MLRLAAPRRGPTVTIDRDDLNPQSVLRPIKPTDWRGRSGWWRSRRGQLIVIAAVCVALIVFARISLQDFKVTGRSMIPTIRTNEMVVVDRLSYDFISPQRGDIIVFHVPVAPRLVYIKRIIAIPGDTVQIYRGKTWVNGRALYEPYTNAPPNYTMKWIPGTRSDRVPPGDYFVLGDNRPRSNDSHRWGLVNRSDIIGRAILEYWPFNHFGFLTDPSTTRP